MSTEETIVRGNRPEAIPTGPCAFEVASANVPPPSDTPVRGQRTVCTRSCQPHDVTLSRREQVTSTLGTLTSDTSDTCQRPR